jgi:ArsR family transcriptional regulator
MRIRILERLRETPSTVRELAVAVNTSQQNVSKHLGVLASVGIVTRRREGTMAWYEIGDETVLRMCDEVCGAIQKQVAELHQILGEGQAR